MADTDDSMLFTVTVSCMHLQNYNEDASLCILIL